MRVSPKKVARYLNSVRGLDAEVAMAKLAVMHTSTATAVSKVIKAAAAQGSGRLIVKKIFVTPGPALKRMMPGAFGRSSVIKKRVSHITVEVGEITPLEKGGVRGDLK